MPVGDRDITLFAGGIGGYGDALDVGRDSYAWSFGFACHQGRAVPIAGPSNLSIASTVSPLAVRMFEWPSGTNTSASPVLLIASGFGTAKIVYEIADGALITGDNETGAIYTGAALYRDGDTEVALFCNGDGADVIRRRAKNGTYSDSTSAKADQLYRISQDLWRVMADYKLEKLTIGTDPGVSGNWPGIQTPVGIPSYPINTVVEMGGSPMPFTGLGVFRYNAAPSVAVFENLTPFVPAHVDNGKGGFADGRGRVYYPTVTGRVLVLTFGSQSQQAPLRFNWIDRDTPWGPIDQMTADEEFVYASILPGSIRTQQLGLVIKSDNGGVFSTHTTNLTDQKRATVADWSALGATDDYIYVGADEPFWGVIFEIDKAQSGSFSPFTVQFSAGSSSWTTVTHKDSTAFFKEDGLIAIIPSTDIFADGSWVTDTVDSEADKYWLRFKPGSGLTSVKMRQLHIAPYRPPIDADLFPESGQMLAGVLPKILIGQWQGPQIIWQDVITLSAARVGQMVVSQVTSADTVGRTALYIRCYDDVYYLPIGPDADPIRAAWPKTNGNTHILAFSGNHFGLPVNVKSVQKLLIHGEFLQADDEFWVYWHYDQADRWYKSGPHSTFPVVVDNLEGRGRVLHVAVQLKDATRDAVAPYITHAIIPEGEWQDLGPMHEALGQDFGSPQTI